jgi:hypothetical protein
VPEWVWWLLAGATAGAATSAVVVGSLLTLEAAMSPTSTSEDYGIAAWASGIAMVYGGFGGVAVAIGSVVVLWLPPVRRRAGPHVYAGVAAALTALLTTVMITPFVAATSLSPYTALDPWVWWAVPIVGTTATASLVGLALWAWAETRSGGATARV